MKNKNLSASVLVFVEDVEDEVILECLKNIKEQTFKNIEVIISSFKGSNSEEVKEQASNMFLNCRWIHHSPTADFINRALDMATGDIVFYKTINNVLWYPRHIESHMELFEREKKLKWSLSHIENKDMSKSHITYNTISFRIQNPPQPSEIIIDEISHYSNVSSDWSKCIVQNGEATGFTTGKILEQWNEKNLRGGIPTEITVIQWVEGLDTQNANQHNHIASSLGVPASLETKEETVETDDGIEISRKIPTIMGNSYHRSHNNNFKLVISQTDDIKSIGLKRTIGMGDVVLCEPIIKYFKNKYPEAEINFYTNSTDIVKYFKHKPDNVIKIEQDQLLVDYLDTTDNDINYDLDLSYESRTGRSFIDSYIESVGADFNTQTEKYPQLECEENQIVDGEYIVVCADSSGWVGKTWPLSDYEEVIENLLNKGEKVIETGNIHTYLTPEKYHNCDFDTMVNIIANCKYYIGTDNGPMHIARSFNKPCIAINGSALTYLSNPNRENIYYLQNNIHSNIGIKHKQFFNLRPDGKGITFMPSIKDGDEHCGIRDIKSHHVLEAIERLNNDKYVFNSFGCVNDNNIMGFSYYKKDNMIQRERPYYHPENRFDIHRYIDKKDYRIKTVYSHFIDDINDKFEDKSVEILDVGSNIGILTNELHESGFENVYGCDINRVAIEMSKNEFMDLKENFSVLDFSTYNSNNKYDIIVMNEVMSNHSDYMDILYSVKRNIKQGGVLYFGDFIYNKDFTNEEYSKGYIVNLFEEQALREIINSFDFRVEDIFNDNNKIYLRCYND